MFIQPSNGKGFINPSGTYKLLYEIEGQEVFETFGEVKAPLLDANKVGISPFGCRGAPNYNKCSLIDTLVYTRNLEDLDTTTCKHNGAGKTRSLKSPAKMRGFTCKHSSLNHDIAMILQICFCFDRLKTSGVV